MARYKFYRQQITNGCGVDILQGQHLPPGDFTDFTALTSDVHVTVKARKHLLTEFAQFQAKSVNSLGVIHQILAEQITVQLECCGSDF